MQALQGKCWQVQQLLQRLVLPLAQHASGLALFYEKMLEVISKEPIARRFAYTVIICLFIAVIWWKLPDVIMAFK